MEVLGWIALANFVKSWFDAASLTAVALFHFRETKTAIYESTQQRGEPNGTPQP